MEDAHLQLLAEKIKSYRVPEAAKTIVREARLLLVAGTAGSGKNTIIHELVKRDTYQYIVSHTTRPSRDDEENGKNYYFVDRATIEEMINSERFVEVKLVHGTHVYGTGIEQIKKIRDADVIGVTDIDVQGVSEYVKLKPDVRSVFLLPPSHDEWMRRLAARHSQDQDELQRRLISAEKELEHALEAGHFHFVINADLNKAVEDVRKFAESYETAGDDDIRVEHAWHVLGELKQELSS